MCSQQCDPVADKLSVFHQAVRREQAVGGADLKSWGLGVCVWGGILNMNEQSFVPVLWLVTTSEHDQRGDHAMRDG